MKKLIPIFLLMSTVSFAQSPPSLDKVKSKYVDSAENSVLNVAQEARYDAIRSSGKSVGIQAGMEYQLYHINQAIKKHERDLDSIYDFGQLMIQGRVVPPVISEVRDIYEQNSDRALKLSGVSYKIEEQARFSSVPPNWRAYLNFGSGNKDYSRLTIGLKLKSEEKSVFQKALEEGWAEGIEQANIILKHGLDRLNRDYVGMLRFNTFVMQGKISMPIIASADIPMTVTNDTLVLDETLLRITILPSFNSNIDQWKGWVTPSKQLNNTSHLKKLESEIKESSVGSKNE